jgi:hypothetical protein
VLKEIVQGLHLQDAWRQDPANPSFTHYSPTGATRIDRFYLSTEIITRKVNIKIYPVPFTDHEAVVLSMSFPRQEPHRRTRRLTFDPTIINDGVLLDKKTSWRTWQKGKRYYPTQVVWWEQAVKPRVQRLLKQAERAKYTAYKQMENHLHECLYDVIRSNRQPREKLTMLYRYKAKLIRHSTTKPRRSLLDLTHKDILEGKTPTIYQVLRLK